MVGNLTAIAQDHEPGAAEAADRAAEETARTPVLHITREQHEELVSRLGDAESVPLRLALHSTGETVATLSLTRDAFHGPR